MSRTPFALFTLLCTLASSIVAAGNASRRAGIEHTPAKVPTIAKQPAVVQQVAYIATAEAVEPAWNAAEWKPIDVRRAYLTLIDRLPKSVRELAPGIEKPATKSNVAQSPVAVGQTAAKIAESKKPAAMAKAPVLNRVGASVEVRASSKQVKAEVRASAKSTLPQSSPLRSLAQSGDAGWNWQSVVVIAGKYAAIQDAWRKANGSGPQTVRIGTEVSKPGVELTGAGIYLPQGYWTPSLHVSESGRQLLGSCNIAPEMIQVAKKAPVGVKSTVSELTSRLENVLNQLQGLRLVVAQETVKHLIVQWLPSGNDRPAAVSAQVRGQNQK
ncbi:MAG: hypothetical protein QM775_22595 [Pirellulales bacterium]